MLSPFLRNSTKRGQVKGRYPTIVKGHNRNQGRCRRGHVKDRIDSRGYKSCRTCDQAKHQARRCGITIDQALAKPDTCELCGAHKDESAHGTMTGDHDHGTGKFRGWVCLRCNRGLELFRDDPELLRMAATYLEERS